MVRYTEIRYSHSSWLQMDYYESVYEEPAHPPDPGKIM